MFNNFPLWGTLCLFHLLPTFTPLTLHEHNDASLTDVWILLVVYWSCTVASHTLFFPAHLFVFHFDVYTTLGNELNPDWSVQKAWTLNYDIATYEQVMWQWAIRLNCPQVAMSQASVEAFFNNWSRLIESKCILFTEIKFLIYLAIWVLWRIQLNREFYLSYIKSFHVLFECRGTLWY